jgi:hypothetical protein
MCIKRGLRLFCACWQCCRSVMWVVCRLCRGVGNRRGLGGSVRGVMWWQLSWEGPWRDIRGGVCLRYA